MDNEQQAQLEAIIQREAHALVAKNNAIPSIKQLDAAVRAAPDYDPVLTTRLASPTPDSR